jgi:hypothetical protein
MGTLMDSLYEVWNQDPVHGERQAYTRIGLALLKHISKKGRVGTYPAAKRTREEHPDPDDVGCQRGRGGGGGDHAEYGRESSPSTSSRSGRETSRTVVFSDSAIPDRRRAAPLAASAAAAATPGRVLTASKRPARCDCSAVELLVSNHLSYFFFCC